MIVVFFSSEKLLILMRSLVDVSSYQFNVCHKLSDLLNPMSICLPIITPFINQFCLFLIESLKICVIILCLGVIFNTFSFLTN